MQDPQAVTQAARSLKNAQHVVVLTGAGMSAESGIDTFRDDGGLWQRFPPAEFGTPRGLVANLLVHPRRLAAFGHAVLQPVLSAQPNPGHTALAQLQRCMRVSVVTQNIDGLHQRAGSTEVHEIHGSFFRVVDRHRRPLRSLMHEDLGPLVAALEAYAGGGGSMLKVAMAARPWLGVGGAGGWWRPNLVLFGEGLARPDWDEAVAAVGSCDGVLVVGTSGTVWPAAALPGLARQRGIPVVGVGPQKELDAPWLLGTAATVLPALVQQAMEDR